ncbi:uncharacterized protein BP5553_03195 [Venustampulla echinocandica]|uniref:Zn(2)-C6 fungal-type domain-containing protein n=1 Tax=Venustampulla echinocandica TaxID=2656787 RepID=A0A370TTK8_9HELO|nr:uncharacterized protein BP5553_03195 [Venustampulla echinocandica]RDL38855.1 hypothetical protein BP5553_03195 [Venustampulla echinocandica]
MQNSEMPLEHGVEDGDIQSEEAPASKKSGSKAQGRKRTKTGCLTCRKRRIKCGEERPTCHNCTKSRRQCEGYNQRVIFKDPLSSYRPSLSTSASTSRSGATSSQPAAGHGRQYQDFVSSQSALRIAPKAEESTRPLSTVENTTSMPSLPSVPLPETKHRSYSFQSGFSIDSLADHPRLAQSHDTRSDTVDQSYVPEPKHPQPSREQAAYYGLNAPKIKQENRNEAHLVPAQRSPQEWPAGPSSASSYAPQELFEDSNRQFPASAASAALYRSYATTADSDPSNAVLSASDNLHDPSPNRVLAGLLRNPKGKTQQSPEVQRRLNSQSQVQPQGYSCVGPFPAAEPTSRLLVSTQDVQDAEDDSMDDEDPFDVIDDMDTQMEEYEDSGRRQVVSSGHLRNNDLGILVALQAGQDSHNLHPRSFTSFIDRPDMLATYLPSPQSSPLNDSMTAKLFCHFVNVTGPSISMYERHPANPSLLFQAQPVPPSQQHIWTYTFPTLALQNPALLHAMLALAGLHIAKLQNRPATASLKHYHISLRRTAKSVGLPTRRGQPATLAAVLLLGFYECWCADHQKWSNHLLGARQLVREIDFAGITRYRKALKIQERQEERMRYYEAQQDETGQSFYDDRARFQAYTDDVDENIVALLMGKMVLFDEYGQVVDENAYEPNTRTYTKRDVELYETQRDLFWWYCKQDAYQSILGGGRLFMEYGLWSLCPPRAPLGRLNAIYGTFDHLVLLLGRIGDFTSKDLKRKRFAMKIREQERANIASQGDPNLSNQKYHQQRMPPMPDFSGMVPGVGEAKLPMGFEPSPESSPQSSESEDMDFEAKTIEAEEEWQDIRNALSILQDHFGEEFQALGPEFCGRPVQTPFGTALQYRTYGIAGIWMNFYMALIACYRAHPSMPPAAMMAAGIAARQTAFFANEIGRITAGICPDFSTASHVNPGVGAALIEATMCLFVAGVQYQHPDQRVWTINRLRDIARLTGWQTALAVAGGCEGSWVKAGEMGHGPPYARTSEVEFAPDIWNRPRRVDKELENRSNQETRMVVSRSERVHFALGLLGVEGDFEHLNMDNEGDQGI